MSSWIALLPEHWDAYNTRHSIKEEDLHCTIAYLGKHDNTSEQPKELLTWMIDDIWNLLDGKKITTRIAGVGQLGSAGAKVLFLNSDKLDVIHQLVVRSFDLDAYHPQFKPWIPHMTYHVGALWGGYSYYREIDKKLVFNRIMTVHNGERIIKELK